MKKLFVVSLLLALAPIAMQAQRTTAQINGTLSDQSGAFLPGATITVTDPSSNFTRSTTSNHAGAYVLTFLPPGTYQLKVEAKGFSKVVQKDITLQVGQTMALNFSLKPGGSTEVVEVTGEPPLIESASSELGGSVSPAEVQDLPVRDRNFASLMQLVPGVRPAPNFDPTKSRSGTVSVNGGDGRSFDYNVDGGDDKDNVIGGLGQNFTLEGIQEFNVITNRYSAESGRTVGGVVNVVTKSGTNVVHGSAFGELQNSALDAKSAFDRSAGPDNKLFTADDVELPKENFKRYHMGGSVGGPIKKDKLFFFGAYEYKRELTKINPDPTAVANLALLPFSQPAAKIPTPFFQHLVTVKMDYKINDKQSVFLRYGRDRWLTSNDQSTSAGTPIADLTEANSNVNQFHSLVLQHTQELTNTKVNVVNVQFQDFVNTILAAPARTFALTVAGGGTAVNPLVTFPSGELGTNINVPQETLIRKYQFRDDMSWSRGKHAMKFGANWIYIAKMAGFFASGLGYEVDFWDDPTDIFGSKAALYPQGLATPGAVKNIFYSAGDSSTTNPQSPHAVGLYFQDDYRITPHLTLNLGLRWDVNAYFLNAQLRSDPLNSNRVINVLRQVVAANVADPAAAAGVARARYLAGDVASLTRTTTSFKEFQPRVGFAWDPSGAGKMVIRGGFGIARDQIFQNLTLWSIQQSNRTLYQSGLIDLENGQGLPNAGPDPFLSAFRFGVDSLPAPTGLATDLAAGARGRITDPHLTDPWAEQFSIGFSRQFGGDSVFSLDYYHVLGFHEPHMIDDNPRILTRCDSAYGGNPNDAVNCPNQESTRLLDVAFQDAGIGAGRFAQIRTAATNNRSLFDSFNFVLKRRMSRSFMFQASYVLSWSRSWGGIPVASYGGSFFTVTRENQFKPNEFGYTDFDERHRFVFAGVFNLPLGFELSPIFQAASPRPIDAWADTDINGDGRSDLDRVCAGFTTANGGSANPANFTPLCTMSKPNSLRGDSFVQMDLSAAKRFKLGERANLRAFWEFHNLFNRFNKCNSVNNDVSSSTFLQPLRGPVSGPYCAVNGGVYGAGGGAFGPGFSSPFRSQVGLRFEF